MPHAREGQHGCLPGRGFWAGATQAFAWQRVSMRHSHATTTRGIGILDPCRNVGLSFYLPIRCRHFGPSIDSLLFVWEFRAGQMPAIISVFHDLPVTADSHFRVQWILSIAPAVLPANLTWNSKPGLDHTLVPYCHMDGLQKMTTGSSYRYICQHFRPRRALIYRYCTGILTPCPTSKDCLGIMNYCMWQCKQHLPYLVFRAAHGENQ